MKKYFNKVLSSAGVFLHSKQRDPNRRPVSRRVQTQRPSHDAQVPSPQRKPALGVRPCGEFPPVTLLFYCLIIHMFLNYITH